MSKDFAEWLRGELDRRGLSQQDLARRGGMSSPGVSQIVRGTAQPRAESIVKIAIGLGEDPVSLLRSYGELPAPLPETADEEEAVRILRTLPYHLRQVAVWMLRGMHAEYLQGDEPRILQEGDRVCVVLVQEGTVVGEAEEPDHYLVSAEGGVRAYHRGELAETPRTDLPAG
jgi:transcriptional regulator with XRE-family HTH domain